MSALALIEAANRCDLPISIDVCLPLLRTWRADILALLPKLTVLFANEPELHMLATGTMHGANDIQTLTELVINLYYDGPEIIVGKCGSAGCIVADRNRIQRVPGFTVPVVDTNGCGDAFAAGFLASRIAGADSETCALYGNACGALTATQAGAAEALPNRARIETFLVQSQQALALAS
jgi:ribokinase